MYKGKNAALVKQASHVLKILGVPFNGLTAKRIERMALSFLAVCQIRKGNSWPDAKDLNDGVAIKTREIIAFLNKYYGQNISPGSYDDVRRKDLKLLVLGDIVVRSNPAAARNDATRGYALNPEYKSVIQSIGTSGWEERLKQFSSGRPSVLDRLTQVREVRTVPITLPSGTELKFSPGEHNLLQKAVVEELLPRYGYGAEVLYVGDTADKFLYINRERLKELKFFELSHGELPDVVAYSPHKNWLYLIEAVHSSGPISSSRLMELQRLTRECIAEVVFITAFLDKETLRRFIKDIAWETEIWIASSPDHMIHLNGDKFMGPYNHGAK